MGQIQYVNAVQRDHSFCFAGLTKMTGQKTVRTFKMIACYLPDNTILSYNWPYPTYVNNNNNNNNNNEYKRNSYSLWIAVTNFCMLCLCSATWVNNTLVMQKLTCSME